MCVLERDSRLCRLSSLSPFLILLYYTCGRLLFSLSKFELLFFQHHTHLIITKHHSARIMATFMIKFISSRGARMEKASGNSRPLPYDAFFSLKAVPFFFCILFSLSMFFFFYICFVCPVKGRRIISDVEMNTLIAMTHVCRVGSEWGHKKAYRMRGVVFIESIAFSFLFYSFSLSFFLLHFPLLFLLYCLV